MAGFSYSWEPARSAVFIYLELRCFGGDAKLTGKDDPALELKSEVTFWIYLKAMMISRTRMVTFITNTISLINRD